MTDPQDKRGASDPAVYQDRRMKEIAVRWDAKAETWDKELTDPGCHLNEDEAYARFLREVRGLITQRQAFCGSRGLIDFGCGTGLVMAEFLPFFAWGFGIDVSPEMLRVARLKRLLKARFICADLFNLPEDARDAAAVLSRGVLLSHYGEKHGFSLLRAGWEALLPGGFLVFDFLNRQTRSGFSHFAENKTYFSANRVTKMAKSAGFSAATILGEKERRVRLLLAEKGL